MNGSTGGVLKSRELGPTDDDWPIGLTEEKMYPINPPERLFITGAPIPDYDKCIAVVGTRRPTGAGVAATRQISRALAQAEYAVVSGLAAGIDAIAHRTALDAGGTTIAVLGAGLDHPYPVRNRRLRHDIDGRGTVVTEYSDGIPPHARHFPERNRIIAALCKATVVIEGTSKSGSLITARLAIDMNRDVFAVPGSIRNPYAEGPNELIRSSNAKLITDVQHIFDDLAPGLVWSEHIGIRAKDGKPNISAEESVVLHAFDDVPMGTLSIARFCKLLEGQTKLILARLEVRGLVVRRRRGWELTDVGARIRAIVSPDDDDAPEAAADPSATSGPSIVGVGAVEASVPEVDGSAIPLRLL